MYHEPLGWLSWSFRTCTDSVAVKRSALLDDLRKDWGKSAEYTRRLVSVNSRIVSENTSGISVAEDRNVD